MTTRRGSLLEQMRKDQSARTNYQNQDNSIYAFWDMKYNQSAMIRFLPFVDPVSQGFWTEKLSIPMKFVDPNDDEKTIKFQAPCLEMYDRSQKCPLKNIVRQLYAEEKEFANTGRTKDAERLNKIAGAHWVKQVSYYQGFVNRSPFVEENSPANPIRIFPFTKQIHKLIYESIFYKNPDDDSYGFDILPSGEFDMDDVNNILKNIVPDDIPEDDIPDGMSVEEYYLKRFDGYNFILKKIQQGEYPNWSSASSWSVKDISPPTVEQLEAISEYGLHDLTKRLPTRPTSEQYDVLSEMLHVSIEFGKWNPEWEEAGIEKPKTWNKDDNSNKNSGFSNNSNSSPNKQNNESNSSKVSSSTLEKLRNRQNKSNSEDDETQSNSSDVNEPNSEVDSEVTSKINDLVSKIKNKQNR